MRGGDGIASMATDDQRREWLAKAAAARRKRAEVKRRVADGEATIEGVLAESRSDRVVAAIRVGELVRSVPGVGDVRARRAMEQAGIAPDRRIRGVGQRQREALVAAVRAMVG